MTLEGDLRTGGGFELDFKAPGFLSDPYPTYHALRAHDPVFLSPWGDWYLTRHADVSRVLGDKRFLRQSPGGINPISRDDRKPTAIDRMLSRWMVFVDPPTHTRLRNMVGKAFTPKRIRALRPEIESLTNRLLDEAASSPDFDLVADLAYPLPVIVISRMLGVPEEDYPLFKDWSGRLTRGVDSGRLSDLRQGNAAAEDLSAYMRNMIKLRRAAPRDDLISAIVAASGDEGPLSEEELVANTVMLLWAGHETTKNLICNGVLALLRQSAQLAILEANPELMESAVEEFLRFDSPIQKITRWTSAATELGDHVIPAGQAIVSLLGAANRDPELYANPDRLDISRDGTSNLAFGKGIHFCLGFALARMEAEIAIGAFLKRSARRELAVERVDWQPTTAIRGPNSLPMTVAWR